MPDLKLVPRLNDATHESAELVIRTGETILVDAEDLPRIKLQGWRLEKYKEYRENVYTHLSTPSGFKKVTLQKFILNLDGQERVQRNPQAHPLDFRKVNLFIGWGADQKRLAGKPRGDFTSLYKGVHLTPFGWRAVISVNRKSIHIGVYPTEIQAALAFDQAAILYFGESCFVNLK